MELAETVEAGAAEGAAMIATAARATVGSAVTITVATSTVVYHSVQATRSVIKANKADQELIRAEHKLNEAIIKKHQQEQQQTETKEKTEKEAEAQAGGAGKKGETNRQGQARRKIEVYKEQSHRKRIWTVPKGINTRPEGLLIALGRLIRI